MQILTKYDLFIFDWDHTLTTSTPFVTFLYLIISWRKQKNAKKSRKDYEPRNAIRNIRIREDVSRFYSVFDDAYSIFFRPRLKGDAIELLEFLKRKHKKIAVFSDSKTYRIMKEMRELGVLKYFDCVVTAESINRYKPNPTGLLLLLDKFKTPINKSVYIGDMASDVLTAKFAGMNSCAVSDGIDTHALLLDAKPTYAFRTLHGFLKALQK